MSNKVELYDAISPELEVAKQAKDRLIKDWIVYQKQNNIQQADEDSVTKFLLSKGYSKEIVDDAVKGVVSKLPPSAPKQEKPKTTPQPKVSTPQPQVSKPSVIKPPTTPPTGELNTSRNLQKPDAGNWRMSPSQLDYLKRISAMINNMDTSKLIQLRNKINARMKTLDSSEQIVKTGYADPSYRKDNILSKTRKIIPTRVQAPIKK